MVNEVGVVLHECPRRVPDRREEPTVANEVRETELGKVPGLLRSEPLARPADLQILLCDVEAAGAPLEGREPSCGLLGARDPRVRNSVMRINTISIILLLNNSE